MRIITIYLFCIFSIFAKEGMFLPFPDELDKKQELSPRGTDSREEEKPSSNDKIIKSEDQSSTKNSESAAPEVEMKKEDLTKTKEISPEKSSKKEEPSKEPIPSKGINLVEPRSKEVSAGKSLKKNELEIKAQPPVFSSKETKEKIEVSLPPSGMEKSDSTKVKNFSGTGNSIPSSTKSNGKEEVASSLNPGSDKTSSISSVSGNPQNNKKKKKAEGTDPSKSSFERGSYHLNRSARNSAGEEFNTSSTTEGEFSTKSKLDLIRLYGLERRKADADGILSGITEPELRFKALFEYAHALETSAGSDKKLKEESIQPLLLIITEAPKENFLVPRALWSLGNLMFRIENFTPSLDYLSRLIKEYPESEYTPGAIYLSGRIYEESPALRNPARAREFYDLFISRSSKSDVSENYSKNIYFEEVKKRRNRLY